MQKGDIVYISYIGKIKESGEIFDLTDEELAKKENVYNPEAKYGDIPIIVGAGFVLPGMDEVLLQMQVGEKRKVELKPDKAFGERKAELIKLIPISAFKQQKIDATPGSYVTINGIRGRIASVAGGRVKVDFNHPLAGKVLEYDLEIKRQVTEMPEKIFAIVRYFTGAEKDGVEIKIDGDSVDIEVKGIEVVKKLRDGMADTIFKWVDGIKKVRFVETHLKPEQKK